MGRFQVPSGSRALAAAAALPLPRRVPRSPRLANRPGPGAGPLPQAAPVAPGAAAQPGGPHPRRSWPPGGLAETSAAEQALQSRIRHDRTPDCALARRARASLKPPLTAPVDIEVKCRGDEGEGGGGGGIMGVPRRYESSSRHAAHARRSGSASERERILQNTRAHNTCTDMDVRTVDGYMSVGCLLVECLQNRCCLRRADRAGPSAPARGPGNGRAGRPSASCCSLVSSPESWRPGRPFT